MKELIQVLTDGHGYETLCTVAQQNNFTQSNGYTRKANDLVNALIKTYPQDSFRVLQK